jgi:hypothetical protein
MRKMKKTLVAALAVIFILSTVATGFAATAVPSDVAGTDFEDAVVRLVALDIISGFEDGTYRPDEPVTRAQMAKIICEATGVGSAAQYAAGATGFSDVAADHWASGYIKVASDMGIVNGMGDGTFAPEAQVTYAQAVTMIVRALGYEPAAQAKGGYPGGYIAIAAEEEISDGVNVVNTLAANRGDIALMVDNSLEVDLMEQETYGQYPEFKKQAGKNLLNTKLRVDKVEGRVVEIAKLSGSPLDEDEIKVKVTEINDKSASGTNKYRLISGDPNELFGLEVTLWVKDKKVVNAEIDTDGSDIFTDKIKSVGSLDAGEVVANSTFKLDKADKTYKVADGALIFVNGDSENTGSDIASGYGRIVLDENNKVIFADLSKWDKDALVVTAVSGTTISYFDRDDSVKKLKLADAEKITVVKDGKTVSLEDIEKDDVIYVQSKDDEYYIKVVSKQVEGELSRVRTDKVSIDGKYYSIPSKMTYSTNLNDDIDLVTDAPTDLADLLAEDVTALLDIDGKVRHIVGDVETVSSDIYAIVLKKGEDMKGQYLKVYNQDGEIVTYTVDDDIDLSSVKALQQGTDGFSLIVYSLDKDGIMQLAKDKSQLNVSGADVADAKSTSTNVATVSKSGDYYTLDGSTTKYYVDSKTKIFNLDILASAQNYRADADLDDIEMLTWADIEDADDANNLGIVHAVDSKNVAKAIVIVNGLGTLGKDDKYFGVVLDKYRNRDLDWVVEVDNGEEVVELQLANNSEASRLVIGSVVAYTLNTKGNMNNPINVSAVANFKLFGSGSDNASTVVDKVYDVSGSFIKLNSASPSTFIKVAPDAIIYDISDCAAVKNTSDAFDASKLATAGTTGNSIKMADAVKIEVADLTDGNKAPTDDVKVFEYDGIIRAIFVGKFD